jgi:hypothetical protein
MFPGRIMCAHLTAMAKAAHALLAYRDTPDPLRRHLRKLVRKLKKDLPPEAIREIEAAEAKATILAADHLRRTGPDS